MNVYELYKPLRNQLRQVCLLDSLAVIRAYLQNIQFYQHIPREIEVHWTYTHAQRKFDKQIVAWDLELLAKEVILNSPDRSANPKSLSQWSQLAGVINKLKRLDDDIAGLYSEIREKNILLELYRLAHKQFPWQRPPNSSTLIRHFRIFSHPDLDRILQRHLGITATQLYSLGLAFTGHFLNEFALEYPPTSAIPGLDSTLVQEFVARFATNISTLRAEILACQSYEEDYIYAFNPLRAHPLILTSLRGKQALIAPVLTNLFRRFTDGVYYDICGDSEFSAAFGDSFQTYVGDVLQAINADGLLLVLPECEYWVGKNRKDSVDWVVADDHAVLFVECKTKRLRYESKIALSATGRLEDDLEKMASFIIQAYRAQLDCMSGHYLHWKPGSRQIFPVIVTLEDWYAFGEEIIVKELDKRVSEGLTGRGIDPSIMQASPYTICAIAGFERAVQIIKKVGIRPFMVRKTTHEKRLWSIEPFMMDDFSEEYRRTKRTLFPDDYVKIHPLIR